MSGSDTINTERGRADFAMVCPYLGLRDDPHTYIGWAQPAHVCHHADPPQSINIYHQQRFCLNTRYTACDVYAEDWQGALPQEIRGEFDIGWGERVVKINIGERKRGNAVAGRKAEMGEPETQDALLSSLRDDYERESDNIEIPIDSPPRKRNYLWYLLPVLVVMLISGIWLTVRGYSQQRERQVSQRMMTLEALALVEGQTKTAQVKGTATAMTNTATASALQAVVIQAQTQTAEAENARLETEAAKLPISTPTAPPFTPTSGLEDDLTPTPEIFGDLASCDEAQAYQFDILSGPELEPPVGHKYVIGVNKPTVRATWRIVNRSPCEWREVNLYSLFSETTIVPYFRVGGELVLPKELGVETTIRPGEEVEILLGFNAETARNVTNEWLLVINGLRLVDGPRITIQVVNWVMGVQPTATDRQQDRTVKETEGPPSER